MEIGRVENVLTVNSREKASGVEALSAADNWPQDLAVVHRAVAAEMSSETLLELYNAFLDNKPHQSSRKHKMLWQYYKV
jgi:hypothetical protein